MIIIRQNENTDSETVNESLLEDDLESKQMWKISRYKVDDVYFCII